MAVNDSKWIQQAKELLGSGVQATHELPPFAVSMITYFYGSGSAQLRAYLQGTDNIARNKKDGLTHQLFMHARGAVANTVRELENGLVGSLRSAAQGELLGDLVGLAREALGENSESTKNVAAVLSAAAFEDTVRRLAAEKTAISGRPKLESVLTALRDADVLKGGSLSLANSMLKFRNDSLHADWVQVARAQVESCLSLTESLLKQHFS